MYCNKENVNILTSLLIAHGVEDVVVCPGSRNAPIVHNLSMCEHFNCYPVTDERSAGFYALGMILAHADCGAKQPVAVCVTSGTALLNLAPAVAEAYYRQLPLIIISADRAEAWIDQLDGQTLHQSNAFGYFTAKSVQLPEPSDDTSRWHCNRLINEALIATADNGGRPVHINVPISEPLFEFTTEVLSAERKINVYRNTSCSEEGLQQLVANFQQSKKRMIVIGTDSKITDEDVYNRIARHTVILHEALSDVPGITCFDEALKLIENDSRYLPDCVIYLGGALVSKRLKTFLRSNKIKYQWRIDAATDVHDTFTQLCSILIGDESPILSRIAAACSTNSVDGEASYVDLWSDLLARTLNHSIEYMPSYSQMAVVKYFEEQLEDMDYDYAVHYANSTAIRLANIYANHRVWCNRGVNGIEGSLSTAAGFSVVSTKHVFCIIGDLSFFYDQNALWNVNLKGNLSIILLNNGRGGIFNQLKGLEQSEARDRFISAEHTTEAQGICIQNDIGYLKATNMHEMQIGVVRLMTETTQRPMLLEVITDASEDEKTYKEYYQTI